MNLLRALMIGSMVAVSGAVSAQNTLLPASRAMTFNNPPSPPANCGYFHADWTHVGPLPSGVSSKRWLLAGTNHTHTTGWALTACRTGTSRWLGNTIPPSYYVDATKTNYQANLQNALSAKIESPYYPEGIGTVYFEAINVNSSVPVDVAVEWATNMVDVANASVTNLFLAAETGTFVYNWQTLDTLSLNAQSANEFTRYQRVLNWREAARFRIRRSSFVSDMATEDALVAVDNIRASYPPSDVAVRFPEMPFVPGYPAAGSNVTLRCFVDNVDMNAPNSNDTRTVTCHYRWRYLDQASNAWAAAVMTLADAGDGAGNGERYEVVLPAHPAEGVLDYYVTCAFGGYRYKPTDYTLGNYVYYANAEGSETLSPRTLWSDGLAGRPFSVRLRPFAATYGAVQMIVDQQADPVEMRLTGDDEWSGWVPCRSIGDRLSVQFRGFGRCVEGASSVSGGAVCWTDAAVAAPRGLPCAGVCGETNENARLTLAVEGGNYVRLTFNSRTRAFTACRAEYQTFNAWTAPYDVFTSGTDSGMSVPLSNTFDTWPTHVAPSLGEFFAYEPAVTNVQATPFATGAGWTAIRAGHVRERLAVTDGNAPSGASGFRNVALCLQGGPSASGLGALYTTAASRTDGLGEISLKHRLRQSLGRYDIAYQCNGFTNRNYAVLANLRAETSLSPEHPSLSVIGYYQDADHFYEFRMSQTTNAANLTLSGDKRMLFELYKWTDGVPYRLASVLPTSQDAVLTAFTPVEFRIYNTSASATEIRCRFGTAAWSQLLAYTDSGTVGGPALSSGSYGFLSSNCRSVFSYVRTQPTTASAVLTGSPFEVLSQVHTVYLSQIADWHLPAGRFSPTPEACAPDGIYSVVPTQTVGVYLMASDRESPVSPASPDDPGWTKVAEVACSSFGYATNRVVVGDWRAQHVMVRNLGRDDGLAVDVAVDEVKLTPWRGQTVSDSAAALSGDWVATEALTVSNAAEQAVSVLLDHGHADPGQQQTLRSPLLTDGMGVFEFDCRVLRAPVRLKIQRAMADQPDTWSDVARWETNAVTEGFVHVRTSQEMGVPGYLRVLNAVDGVCTNAAVLIDQALAWNTPPAGPDSWVAYNAKISAADPSRIWLDGSKACFLNTSPTQEARPVMDLHEPYLQTPVLTNGLGTLTFLARAYGTNETATLRLLASTNGWNAADHQWFEVHRFEGISNSQYRAFSYTPEDGRGYSSLRLATSTSGGAKRVCLEEVSVAEPPAAALPPLSQRIPAGVQRAAAFYADWLQRCGLAQADLSKMDAERFDSAWLFDQNPVTFLSGEVRITEMSLDADTVHGRFVLQAVNESGRSEIDHLNGRLVLLGSAALTEPFVEIADVSAAAGTGQMGLPKAAAALFVKLAVVFPE